jgi:hypothetical protein
VNPSFRAILDFVAILQASSPFNPQCHLQVLFQVSFSSLPSFLLINFYSSLFLNFFVSPLSASDFLPCSPLSYFYSLFLNFVTLFVQHSLSAMASSSAAPSNSASVWNV